MRAFETLVTGLALPAPACLLGLLLAVLAWLDDGEYLRLGTWTAWRSPPASGPACSTARYGSRSNFPA
jgi:hypothetical protein